MFSKNLHWLLFFWYIRITCAMCIQVGVVLSWGLHGQYFLIKLARVVYILPTLPKACWFETPKLKTRVVAIPDSPPQQLRILVAGSSTNNLSNTCRWKSTLIQLHSRPITVTPARGIRAVRYHLPPPPAQTHSKWPPADSATKSNHQQKGEIFFAHA